MESTNNSDNKDRNLPSKLSDFLKGLNLPDWLVNNFVTALGKGVYGTTLELTEIPVNHLKNHNERIKLKGKIKRELILKASKEYSKIFEVSIELAERALGNYGIQILEEQENRESIAFKTIKQLENIEGNKIDNNSDKKAINHDWLTAFWKLAETKSENEIQEILAKILANEIVRPASVSLHTLQALSVLSSDIGKAFQALCNLSITDRRMTYFIHPNVFNFQNIGILDDYGIEFEDLLKLDGAGLIRSVEVIRLQLGASEFEEIDFAGIPAKIQLGDIQVNLIYFTQAGHELRNLMQLTPHDEYTKVLKERLGDKLMFS